MRKLIVNDGMYDRELQLVDRLIIGRDPECDLSDTNTLLSRRHAEFTANGTDVIVRDLGSRNGVFINGARVAEGTVRPGDVVRIGHFSIRYVEVGAGTENDPRRTEATVAFPMGMEPGADMRSVRPSPAGAAAAVAVPPAPVRAARPAPPLPSTVSAVPTPDVRAASAAASESSVGGGFVLVRVAAAALVGLLSAAIPLLTLQSRAQASNAEQHAQALVQWLGAEAAAAIGTGASAGMTADLVARQPGVVAASVLSIDGTVLSPRSRAGETIASIPALNVGAGDVRSMVSAWNGNQLEIVRPVESADGRRVGVAWVTFQPSAALPAETLMVWLAFPLVVVLLASWVAAELISRRVASVRKA